MSFEIQSGVPIPSKRTVGRQGGSKYPFAQMDVGDMFWVTHGVKPATMRSAVGAYNKRYPEHGKFAVRQTADGLGVWRIE